MCALKKNKAAKKINNIFIKPVITLSTTKSAKVFFVPNSFLITANLDASTPIVVIPNWFIEKPITVALCKIINLVDVNNFVTTCHLNVSIKGLIEISIKANITELNFN